MRLLTLQWSANDQSLVTNLRHYESLKETLGALEYVLLALDIRSALHHLGEITTEDLLENIFSKFCWKINQ